MTSEIRLIGADSKEGEITPANITYNFADKELDFYGGIEGFIKGEIEVSAKILVKARAKSINNKPLEDKKNKELELSIGVQGSSYITITSPLELNEKGNLDMDFYFSGVKIEVWFRASYSSKNSDGEPDFSEIIIPSIDVKKTIEF